MATPPEIQMLRNADPGVVLPGIDKTVGNKQASLKSLSSFSTDHSASIYYDPKTNNVIVKKDHADLSNYNFGTATVAIEANGVTVENCTFSGTTGDWALRQFSGYSGAIVKNNTFIGGAGTHDAFIGSLTNITVTGNEFIAAAGDAVDVNNGTISGNYFLGGGYNTAHSDAIWVTNTTGSVSITGNLIDWTYNVWDGSGHANNAVRITTELGSVSNVTVSGNYLLGGCWTVDAGNKVTSGYTYSNIAIKNNYLGFGLYGAFYHGPQSGVTESGNVIFDFTNRAYSDKAWAAYKAAGISTDHLVVSNGSNDIVSASSGSTTLYGDGGHIHMSGRSGETVFIGGAGGQSMWGGTGRNLFTYLAISDSRYGSYDGIGNFHLSQDVIDLSHIDADLTKAGVQSFKFIGTSAFSKSGGEVRYQIDSANNATWIEADLTGDSRADLIIRLGGQLKLTSANFALTASESKTDLASGASTASALTAAPTATHSSTAGDPALNSSLTPAQDLAAVLSHSASPAGQTIAGRVSEPLSLADLAASPIAAHALQFHLG